MPDAAPGRLQLRAVAALRLSAETCVLCHTLDAVRRRRSGLIGIARNGRAGQQRREQPEQRDTIPGDPRE